MWSGGQNTFLSLSESQRSVVLPWTELCFNSSNKIESRKQYQTFVFMWGRNQETVLTQLWKKRCSAFCDEKLMSYISPLVYEKGNISSYMVTSFLLCYLDYRLFPLSPPGLSACPASSLYKTWCYCLLPACVSSLKLIKVYENHNLSLPSGTSTWDCTNVSFFSFLFILFEKTC